MTNLQRTKRIIYFSLFLALILIAVFFAWRFLTTGQLTKPAGTGQEPITGNVPGFPIPTPAGAPPTPAATSTPPDIAQIPPSAQKLLQLTDYSIIGPSLNKAEDRVLFYKKDGGGLFSIDFDGEQTEKLSPLTIVGLLDAIWGPRRDRSAVQYLDQETIKSFLHIGTSSVAVLPADARSPAWSPDGKSFSYILVKNDRAHIIVTDISGKNPKTIFSTPMTDISITWATGDQISILTAPSGLAEGFLFLYSQKSGILTQVLGPHFGLTALWSPNGSRALVSSTNSAGQSPQLAILNAINGEIRRLSFFTLPEKCAWSHDSQDIFCAVPSQTFQETIWPDDYLRGALASSDRVIDMITETGEVMPRFEEKALYLSHLFMTKDKAYLFFINRFDGTLWRYKLQE